MAPRDISLLDVGDRPLRVRVEDAEDLAIAASLLQDALLPVREMTFERQDDRFAMVVHRYKWESAPSTDTVPATATRSIASAFIAASGSRESARSAPMASTEASGTIF